MKQVKTDADFVTPTQSRWPPKVGKRCVAVKRTTTDVKVRDSKNPEGPVLSFTHDEWDAFLHGVRNSEFDLT